ncbi:hypothetical protein HN011_009700 [Eciton burchellii]|nr:hypothetical protein HN011_009700 [Eciton burchellii]
MGNQTLGEEYTGIVQADPERHKIPTLTLRVSAAILECFGEKMLLQLLGQLQARAESSAKYYSLGRRIAGSDYAKVNVKHHQTDKSAKATNSSLHRVATSNKSHRPYFAAAKMNANNCKILPEIKEESSLALAYCLIDNKIDNCRSRFKAARVI